VIARISVIVPTKDEELHIGRCLDSVAGLGSSFVVDALSSDRTREIARACGATVVEHAWEGYSAQKNWALDALPLTSEWVLFLDADEYILPAAQEEIVAAIADECFNGYLLARRFVFLGRELQHAWWYPDYQLRLFRRGQGRFEERLVHEHVIVKGSVGQLSAPIMHENVKGLSAFVARHNKYSDLEAAELLRPSEGRKRGSFRGSWADRRRAFKDHVWFRIPFRPTARFLWLYVVKRGFLDGRRGLLFCRLIAMYELLIDAKVMELRLQPGKRSATRREEC
jgi:glycosyltransferase involved in cell wall biosynthesis